jgi:hypothetical protein
MKIYSEKIGPVQYFSFIGSLCFFLPYAGGIPKYWPACLLFSAGAFYWMRKSVKKEEVALRAVAQNDPRIAKVVIIFVVLMMTNAWLINRLQR